MQCLHYDKTINYTLHFVLCLTRVCCGFFFIRATVPVILRDSFHSISPWLKYPAQLNIDGILVNVSM